VGAADLDGQLHGDVVEALERERVARGGLGRRGGRRLEGDIVDGVAHGFAHWTVMSGNRTSSTFTLLDDRVGVDAGGEAAETEARDRAGGGHG
jgi:hypothetical protein